MKDVDNIAGGVDNVQNGDDLKDSELIIKAYHRFHRGGADHVAK